jgi:fatty-acyl-CoA synthase
VAGSACPPSLLRRFDRFGVRAIQAWGMTETTPIASVSTLKPAIESLPADKLYELRAKQGIAAPFLEVRIMAEHGEAPWDGRTQGELQVRGPTVAQNYYKQTDGGRQWTADGWLRTGDIATIDPQGYIKITDRAKDLIKSGGEWISSVDLENAIVSHPKVAEAAVIAVPHPKWQERPLALVVPRDGASVSESDLWELLGTTFAKWQLPDAVVFVPRLPHTSTGKLLKSELRAAYGDWYSKCNSGERQQ